jgi:hypothetical protein
MYHQWAHIASAKQGRLSQLSLRIFDVSRRTSPECAPHPYLPLEGGEGREVVKVAIFEFVRSNDNDSHCGKEAGEIQCLRNRMHEDTYR